MSRFKSVCLDCRSQNCHDDNHRLLSWSSKLTVPAKSNNKAWKLIENGDPFWDKRKVSRKAQNMRISNDRNRIARLAEKRQMKSQLHTAREKLLEGEIHWYSKSDFVELVMELSDDTLKTLLNAVAYRIFGLNDTMKVDDLIKSIEKYLTK